MKVAVIFLNYHRKTFTDRVKSVNLNNAGYPFSLIEIDRKGIAAALNEGIRQAAGHDAIVTMANDILMPDDWLAQMAHHASVIKQTGMCGIHTVEGQGDLTEYDGLKVYQSFTAFGNVLIPMRVIDRIGGFNEEYDPYGMQDADFALRCNRVGFVNYYIAGMKAEHIGHDVGEKTDYRKMKDEGLSLAEEKWNRLMKQYEQDGYHVPIIEMKQMEGE